MRLAKVLETHDLTGLSMSLKWWWSTNYVREIDIVSVVVQIWVFWRMNRSLYQPSVMVNQLYSVPWYPRFTICFTPRFLKIPYGSNDGNISKIYRLKRLYLVYKISMWCLREFCGETDPDDKVKILYKTVRVTSKWRKTVKFSIYNSP